MGKLSLPKFGRHREEQDSSTEAPDLSLSNNEKSRTLDDRPVPRLTWRSFVMGAFVSIGGIIFGYDTGQISGFLEMKNYLHRYGESDGKGGYEFSNVRSGLIVALLSIGTLMGALMAAPIADRIGRKWSISFWCVILHIGLIVQISAPTGKWYQIVVGRWITGLGVGSCSLLVPMYQGESAPRHIRGAMVCSYQLFITLGIFLANCVNFGTEGLTNTASWRIPLGITHLWGLLLGIGILFFPESPRYDYRHGKIDRAKKTLTRLYGLPDNHRVIVNEFLEIKEQFEQEQAQPKVNWYEMFSAPKMARRILLGVVLQALQQLTGANYFFYYGTTVFNGAGISNSYVTQMIMGGVNFGTTFGGLYIIEHFGRRKSLITGALWMFVCFMVYASIGHFVLDLETPENTPQAGKAMVVFACLFITGFAMTWGPMIWAIVAEIYPSRYRARSMALATASNWLWNFLLAFFTPFIAGDIDFAYGYVFAGCLLVAALVVYFFVIEGQGRTLEEMDTMYIMGIKPWKSSKYELPPPEERVGTEEAAGVAYRPSTAGSAHPESRGKQNGTENSTTNQHEEHA